ncbi:hypothetical protein PG989_004764 [Apiospora arundinis]
MIEERKGYASTAVSGRATAKLKAARNAKQSKMERSELARGMKETGNKERLEWRKGGAFIVASDGPTVRHGVARNATQGVLDM